MRTDQDSVFEDFLKVLEPGIEGGERFGKIRAKLIKFFAWRGSEDPQELADETIIRLMQELHSGRGIQGNPYSYVYGVAAYVFKDHIRQRSKREAELVMRHVEEPDAFLDCARACMQALSHDKRTLLEAYYSDEDSRESLAQSLGISITALRIRVHRIKQELRLSYMKCIERTAN